MTCTYSPSFLSGALPSNSATPAPFQRNVPLSLCSSSTFVRFSGRSRIAQLPCNDCHSNALLPVLLRKYNAIVESGIPIHKRYDIPDHLIPPDSRVEIDAKIAAGYFTSGKQITQEDLAKTVGRTWEETEH